MIAFILRKLFNAHHKLVQKAKKIAFGDPIIIGNLNLAENVTMSSKNIIHFKKNTTLNVGKYSHLNGLISFDRENAEVSIGNESYLGGNLFCASKIHIGNNVLISSAGGIMDHDSHSLNSKERISDVKDHVNNQKNWDVVSIAPITICDKAWVGFNVTILKGVTIGEGAIVAAGSVVTKNVEPYTLVAGNPARFIKKVI